LVAAYLKLQRDEPHTDLDRIGTSAATKKPTSFQPHWKDPDSPIEPLAPAHFNVRRSGFCVDLALTQTPVVQVFYGLSSENISPNR
jgi:hypothetical protein